MLWSSRTLARIDAETRPFHADADDCWLSLVVELTRARYLQHLILVYGLESPIEAAVAYTPRYIGLDAIRPRSGYIVEDLIALGMRPARIAQLEQFAIAPFATKEEALGWVYVVERATLLHGTVRLHVEARLPTAVGATAYLRSAEGRVETRWHQLDGALRGYDGDDAAQQRIVDAARDAFRTSHDWYRGENTLRSVG